MLDITFEVAGDVQIARSLSRFGEGVKDMRPVFEEIAKLFFSIERRQFDSEGSYGSGRWAPLSPTYADWKERNFPGQPILQRSRRLMSSLIGVTSDTVKETSPMSFRIGTSVPYAIYHQEGTGRMPMRKVIDLTESDKREWTKVVQRWLVDIAKKAGLR